jgi:hypothetical protein
MTPQEQEHLDHVLGSATEHQNCHQESKIRNSARESKTSVRVIQLTSLGLYVATEQTTALCPVTDGIVGVETHILGAFPTEKMAETFILMYVDRYGYEGDSHFKVMGPLPKPPVRAKEDPLGPPETSRELEEAESHGIDMDDDIPF